jgi:hypothetical protein
MTKLGDVPGSVVSLITRYARTRQIPGTNKFARVCRSWRDAGIEVEDHEQLQLLLPLDSLPPGPVTSTIKWIAQHGACVTTLHVIYDPITHYVFRRLRLPLSTAPMTSLARLDVYGPESLVVVAPALPQLVALTHLRASITMTDSRLGPKDEEHSPLKPMQQLCPGLKSLDLTINATDSPGINGAQVPVAHLLPAGLQQLQIKALRMGLDSAALTTSLTALRSLSLVGLAVDPNPLFHMPELEQLELVNAHCWVDRRWSSVAQWLAAGMCTAPQRLTKLCGMSLSDIRLSVGALQSLVTAAPGLRSLEVSLGQPNPAAAAWVQQLSGFSRLQRLSLGFHRDATGDATALVSSLCYLQHLTCLLLGYRHGGVQPSTWAGVLPHLPQLRVLGVSKPLLLEGLVLEVTQLSQLQCLYVESHDKSWEPAATGAQVVPHLQVLSQCSSLQAVLCWAQVKDGAQVYMVWEHVHQGNLHLSCWDGWRHAAVEGRVLSPRAAPHLPDMWELQQQEPADGLSCD